MWSWRLRVCLVLLSAALLVGLSGCNGSAELTRAPDATSYTFDARVTEEQRAEITAAVATTADWLASQAAMPMPVLHITAAPDGDVFTEGLAGRYRMTASDAGGILATIPAAAALTVGHDILLIVDDRWKSLGPETRSFVIAHEIFHVVQYVLAAGPADAPAGGNIPGPAWLVEGAAEFVAANVMSASGGRSIEQFRREYEARGRMLGGRLGDLENVSAHAASSAQGQYTLGFLAAGRLASRSGTSSLLGLWRSYGQGASWERAFRDTFGESVAAFSEEFDAHLTVDTAAPIRARPGPRRSR